MTIVILQEAQGGRFYAYIKTVHAIGRGPGKVHLPAVQVPGESEVGVHKGFVFKIVRNIADIHAPVFSERYVARYVYRVAADEEGILFIYFFKFEI